MVARRGMACASPYLSLGVEDTFKIFQFRVFESAVVGTSDARKNAATKVRRQQQRARATGGVRRETPSRQSRKSGDGEERAIESEF